MAFFHLPMLLLLFFCWSTLELAGFNPLIQELPGSSSEGRSVSVDDFGAKGDGYTDDTKAFGDAWLFACSSPYKRIIEIPAGKVYLVKPIDFAGPCKSKLTLLIMGTIIAPPDPKIWDGQNTRKWLYFHGIRRLIVAGGGTINGMGQKWWSQSCKINKTKPCQHAPTAITFHRTKHLIIQELTLMNSQQMHMSFTNCFHVKASRMKLVAPPYSPNTDGIHISASTSVVIQDSTIETGDDCISVVSNSSNVRIRNIACGPGHGISIGSLGKSRSLSQVHDVRVDGAFISNTENGVRIKTWQGGCGFVSNIVFHNIFMRNVSNPIIIDQYYCDSPHQCANQTSAVKVEDVSFIGIKGTSATENAIKFACSDSFPCERIFLEDICLAFSGGEPTSYCWKASGLSFGLVHPPSCLSSSEHLNLNKTNGFPASQYAAVRI
ncbi:Polygalacturonase protein [Dioscorea alata]|uniref:Polygalacturonase protein n=1 Tax=Dioscorea alata TaxID=55571 RepID=A0ACB7TVU5_DIOAL|nr:Polygalacturonase protein [Dioscorea alata]